MKEPNYMEMLYACMRDLSNQMHRAASYRLLLLMIIKSDADLRNDAIEFAKQYLKVIDWVEKE